jgi:hypothetical protein
LSESVRRASASLAIKTRYKGASHPETIEARRALAAAKLEAYIKQVVEAAPALSTSQRDYLANLFYAETTKPSVTKSKLVGKPASPPPLGEGEQRAFPTSCRARAADDTVEDVAS